MHVKKHIGLLGLRVKDRVTGAEGVVSSVSFDLYGCIQALVDLGLDVNGEPRKQLWMDVSRLMVTDEKPVMDRPDFDVGMQAEGRQGPADKPPLDRFPEL